ncbi:MAG TPA: choice-of-anchor D domain-containing protein [Kofleriaceae bacterium]|nr:choice-of-anchor D domain-containing protein [Kofleriaceae bacterium]
MLFVALLGSSRAAHAAFAANPTTAEAGTVAVGSSGTATTTLTNDTSISVTLSLDTSTGCSEFSINPPTTLTIDATGEAVSLTFTPLLGGSKTCIVFVKDGGGGPVGMFNVHGTATGTPMITITTTPPAFGHVDVGTTSPTQRITAKNTGTDTLTISSAAVVTTPSNYAVTGTTGTQMVAPGGSVNWDIGCKPAQGTADDTFRITSNGSAMPTDIAMTCTGDRGVLAVDKTTLDFGALGLNTNKTLPVVLSNTGNVAVTGITAALASATKGYSFDAATVPAMLAGGTNATVMVTFAPTTPTDGGSDVLTFSGSWTSVGTHTTSKATTLMGQTIDLTVSTPTLAFGDFRFDSRPVMSFQITNGGSAALLVSLSFAADPGTDPSELPYTVMLGGATANLSNPLPAGMHYDVAVTAQPNDRTGAIGGAFAVHLTGLSDLPVTVTGNATAAAVQITGANFGPVDIQATAPKLTAMIKNTSAMLKGDLTVSAVTMMTTTGTAGVFTFTNPLPTGVTTLMPGTALPIEVTYKPTVQRGPTDADTVVLTATLTGALDGPKAMTITLTGRGIDRDLVLPAPPAFPTTFRNPGDSAPVIPVTVLNGGEAPLNITATMISGDPVWQLVDGAPVVVPGGTTHDFMVKFAPNAVGPAPTGQLTLTNDDHTMPMAMIPLNGMGTSRDVAFGPQTGVEPRMLNIGETGVGIPLTADDILLVVNKDPSATFSIHAIRLDDDSAFQLAAPPTDQMLAPGATQSFAVTFNPSKVGTFQATATLYLDQDPFAQSQVVLAGDAVFAEAHGGGGCDAGGASGSGGLAIGLAALGVIGRRRRRAVAS